MPENGGAHIVAPSHFLEKENLAIRFVTMW